MGLLRAKAQRKYCICIRQLKQTAKNIALMMIVNILCRSPLGNGQNTRKETRRIRQCQ
jgi:hypothetical protein